MSSEEDTEEPPKPLDPAFEPSFLKNTITFASNLRVNAALAMYKQFEASDDPMERRLLFLGIHQQMCMAMEDLGAHLYAYREKQSGKDYMTALINYGGSSAYLYDLFKDKSKPEILADFGFEADVPPVLKSHGYTDRKRREAGDNFYAHFLTVAKKQEQRIDICNKLKHGATSYLPESNDQLGLVLRRQRMPEAWRLSYKETELKRLSYKETELKMFLYIITTCSHQCKEIVFQYLCLHHPVTAEEILEWEYARKDMERTLALLTKFEVVVPARKAKQKTHKRSKKNKRK